MSLKPQDIVIALKFAVMGDGSWTYSSMSVDLAMSASEINGGVKRLLRSGLLQHPLGPETRPEVNRAALAEFMRHGLRYTFPLVTGTMVRGTPTSYGAPPLASYFVDSEDPPPVWPWEHGQVRGLALQPLYRTVPEAAAKDDRLYRALAVADGMRDGSPRVRDVAGRYLDDLLGIRSDAS